MNVFKKFCLYLLLFSLIGCEGTEAPSKVVYQHALKGRPNTLDPLKASNNYSSAAVLTMFDTLYSYKYLKRPYEIKPNLASGMPLISSDKLTYTIEIKKGVMFHDDDSFLNGVGREVTADDFVYSIKRHYNKAQVTPGAWLWRDHIAGINQADALGSKSIGISALDKYTIQIKLIKPYPQLIHTLAMAYSAVVPKEAVEKYGRQFGIKPVGSGPYKLKSFNSQMASFIKNEAFRHDPIDILYEGYDKSIHDQYGLHKIDGISLPFVDELQLHFIEESMSRWTSFTKGNEIQYTTIPPSLSGSMLKSKSPLKVNDDIADKYRYLFNNELGFAFFGFNLDSDEFGVSDDPVTHKNNKHLRCAIRKAHNWDLRNEAFYLGIGNVFPGVIPPNLYDYDNMISHESVNYDLVEAKQILKEGNWTAENLPMFKFHAVANVQNKQIFEQTRGFLKQLGFPEDKIEYEPYASFGQYNKAVKSNKASFFFMGWSLDYPDAQNTMQLFYGPNSGLGPNTFNYKNKDYDALYEKTSSLKESAERKKLYRSMNQMVIDDCVHIGSINRTFVSLWHNNIILFPSEDLMGAGFIKYAFVENN